MNASFQIFAQLPAGFRNVPAVIAACRAGAVGVINAELAPDSTIIASELAEVAAMVRTPFGVCIDRIDDTLADRFREFAAQGLGWLIVDPGLFASHADVLAELRTRGVRVLVRVTSSHWPAELEADREDRIDGLMLKGHEAGGFTGEDSSFVLLQKWLGATSRPLYVHGGLTPEVAAACSAFGVAGGVFDSQLLLLDDVRAPSGYRELFSRLAGSETVAVGSGEHGEYFRVLVRPGHTTARTFASEAEGQRFSALRSSVAAKIDWGRLRDGLLPIGQDICFAAQWSAAYGTMARLFGAVRSAIDTCLRAAVARKAIFADGPLSRALNVRLPIVQGPMTRVSDRAEFAQVVAEAGALPMLALALVKGPPLRRLLADTAAALGDRPWGVGLLGFAPQALLDEQLAASLEVAPSYAIIAGGRPDQAVQLEAAGIPSFLHVPAAALIGPFLRGGARRFIFEGRECGGHVGPLSSFVLWSTMVAKLAEELDSGTAIGAAEIQVLFAGGIHDAVSSGMVQVLAAPLSERGVNVGILMGSAYLFTQEIVQSGAIVPRFQHEVVACERTVTLASGPGHASRCAYTPFAEEFFRTKERLERDGIPADEGRRVLDDLIIGRLRIASKGIERRASDGQLEDLDEARQHTEGMYMLGQVATLRSEIIDVATLHAEVSEGAAALLEASLLARDQIPLASERVDPADVAIIGIGSLFPGSKSTDEYWDNILDNVDTITEIPRHRWDWRLYFDADRNARDKIYSKWGGFLDDLVFDPTTYGMPPRSVASVDPMQLIALEVAHRTLRDAGYADRSFDHGRTAIVLGASGGAGDVGTQYCLRAEMPRFTGDLPAAVADQLPEWTEDSFAGILANVTAGRVANRLNFGGVNFTTDAACASSLASVYQGVSELCSGRSDLVIAGGVDTVQGPFGYLCFSRTQALSPRGRCSSFDENSDGIVISEGVAMIALKRLADAERDGDRIYAVIKGVAGSSDGRARGMTAPVPAGQLRAMRRAYRSAGFGPETVGLFEAHGTGTVAGDVAELTSTTELVRAGGGRARQSVIGSVKTMIGHTKSTAGVAGMIKVALALHRRVLPPHLGVKDPNPLLQDESCPLYLIDEARPWLVGPDEPRRGAVSAFGFGGTNFHVVMEEHAHEYRRWLRPRAGQRWPAELLVWSADDREGLIANLERLRDAMTADTDVVLRDLAAGLAARLKPAAETVAIVAQSTETLAETLAATLAFLRGETPDLPRGVYHGSTAGEVARGKVAVLFSGQGSQYTEMLRELMVHFDVCAETLAQADQLLRAGFEARFGSGRTLGQFVFPRACYGAAAKRAAKLALTATDVAQPALGAVGAAAFALMQSLGLKPDLLGGHSYGEFVALYAAGAIDFEAMLTLSAARGRAIVDASAASGTELGTMAAALARRDQVEAVIATIDGVVIANHNGPEQIVLSGTHVGVAEAGRRLKEQGVRVTEFPVAAGFHSPQVSAAGRALASAIEAAPWNPTRIPVYSNTTAEPHAEDVATTKRVMAEHLVRPVEFVAQIEAMYRDGARKFVELGPKSVLSRLVDGVLGQRPHLAVSIDRTPGIEGLLGVVAELMCAGVELDLAPLFARRATALPDPYALPVKPVAPKYAWVINGSRARPAGTPVQQIGVTYEEVQARAAAPQTVAPQVAAPPIRPLPQTGSAEAPRGAAVATPRPGPSMPVAAVARPAASSQPPLTPSSVTRPPKAPMMSEHDQTTMNGYFGMMRQFLETQERVMSLYMRAQTGAQPGRSYVPAERVLPPGVAYPAMSAGPAVASAPPPPPAVIPVVDRSTAPLTNGHPVAPAHNGQAAPAASSNGHVAVPAPAAAAPPAPAAAPVAPAAQAKAGSAGLDRAALTELLLSVVEDKTGYPRDMVDLSQNLESDLGIDSIKRVEVASAMLEFLPEDHRKALTPSLGELNTQPTLDGMLNILSAFSGQAKETTVPFDVPGAGVVAELGHPPRYVVVPREQLSGVRALRRICKGHFIVTADALGVALAVAEHLHAMGCSSSLVPRETLVDEMRLQNWIAAHSFEPGQLAGIVHLAPIGATPIALDASLEQWRRELLTHEKSLFMLLRDYNASLPAGGHVLAASSLGGWFGRMPPATPQAGVHLQGGAVGLLKSHHEERPNVRVRALDVDPELPVATIAQNVLDELTLVGGRLEIGYPAGRRTAFHTELAPVAIAAERFPSAKKRVVLATGGGRGVTAEILRELAIPGSTLIVTGRRPLPEDESPATAQAVSATELRNQLIAQVRSGTLKLAPAEIGRRVQATLAARELRQNIAEFERLGAVVEYHAVDVTDEASLRALLADVGARIGAVTGVLHGAGIIEDKLVVDKTGDSWSRVVETKVVGLLSLQKLVAADNLEFFAVMSSVAGRYGNSGQADYATANELMNRLCCQLRARSKTPNVMALCWGPWGPTQFGQGMVSAGVEAKFAEKGVRLVSAAVGRRLFGDELRRVAFDPVELVCGEGPWEAHEAALGASEEAASGGDDPVPATQASGQRSAEAPNTVARGPLIGDAQIEVMPKGERILAIKIDANHTYLSSHRLDGVPILPAAAAVEMFAEAAAALWPGWKVLEVRDCRLLKGVELGEPERTLHLEVSLPGYGGPEGFEVNASLRSPSEAGRPPRMHYRCVLRLGQQYPESFSMGQQVHTDRQLTVEKAYEDWLFHGQCFQVIERFDGFSPAGSQALAHASSPSQWLARASDADHWLVDPALLDAGPQIALLWARCFRDQSVLPTRFGRVLRYRDLMPARVRMVFECLPTQNPSQVRANVYYVDADDQVVLAVEDLEGVGSSALKRLSFGYARETNASVDVG